MLPLHVVNYSSVVPQDVVEFYDWSFSFEPKFLVLRLQSRRCRPRPESDLAGNLGRRFSLLSREPGSGQSAHRLKFRRLETLGGPS